MKNYFRLCKIICISLIFNFQFSIFNSAQAQVTWHTIEEAANAKIGTKMYFIDFYTSWCGYCKKMDRETFSDPTVAKILNRYFYPVKFNAEGSNTFTWFGKTYHPVNSGRNRTHEFARGLQGYPSFALVKADGSVLQTIPGYSTAKEFTVILWYFVNGDYNRYAFDRYQKIFDKDIRPAMEKSLKD